MRDDILNNPRRPTSKAERARALSEITRNAEQDCAALILPSGHKDCWQDCAMILAGFPDEKLIPLLPKLMEWFQDMTWPGAEIMAGRIRLLPSDVVKKAYFEARQTARAENDADWSDFLKEEFGASCKDE